MTKGHLNDPVNSCSLCDIVNAGSDILFSIIDHMVGPSFSCNISFLWRTHRGDHRSSTPFCKLDSCISHSPCTTGDKHGQTLHWAIREETAMGRQCRDTQASTRHQIDRVWKAHRL